MVKHITYKGKKYPVRLSYRVFKGLKQDNPKSNSKDIMEDLEGMLWYGLVSGHKAEDKEIELKREDMEDVLDECMFEFQQLIPLFFPKAKTGNAVPDQEVTEEVLTTLEENETKETTI